MAKSKSTLPKRTSLEAEDRNASRLTTFGRRRGIEKLRNLFLFRPSYRSRGLGRGARHLLHQTLQLRQRLRAQHKPACRKPFQHLSCRRFGPLGAGDAKLDPERMAIEMNCV